MPERESSLRGFLDHSILGRNIFLVVFSSKISRSMRMHHALSVRGGQANLGDPQISSGNRKSANVQTNITCWIRGPSANVTPCGFAFAELI
jgi:hypothetical protein